MREPGDYAVRGGIVDLWPPGAEKPLRLDFFGDTLGIDPPLRRGNAAHRRRGHGDRADVRSAKRRSIPASISRFRAGYVAAFGAVTDDDPLYEAVSAGRKHAGMEHWLPLFHPRLETLFDYAGDAPVSLDRQIEEAREARLELIADYYDARVQARAQTKAGETRHGAALQAAEAGRALSERRGMGRARLRVATRALSPFNAPECRAATDAGGGAGATSRPSASQGTVGERLRSAPRTSQRCKRRRSASSSPAGARAPPTAWAACSPITA